MGEHEALSWRGLEAIDRDGDKLGKIKEIFLDNDTDEPEWAVVGIGLLGRKVRFIPLRGATERDGFVRVDVEKERLEGAPQVDEDAELNAGQERELYEHYGLDYDAPGQGSGGVGAGGHGHHTEHDHEHGRHGEPGGLTGERGEGEGFGRGEGREGGGVVGGGEHREGGEGFGRGEGREGGAPIGGGERREGGEGFGRGEGREGGDVIGEGERREGDGVHHGTAEDDRGVPPPDAERGGTRREGGIGEDAMTRSEEEVHIGTETRPRERVRLKKHVVTDYVTKKVPVQREELHVEREPADGPDREEPR